MFTQKISKSAFKIFAGFSFSTVFCSYVVIDVFYEIYDKFQLPKEVAIIIVYGFV